MSPALIILAVYVLLDLPDSFIFKPAEILSLPIGNLKNSTASSLVIINGIRYSELENCPEFQIDELRSTFIKSSLTAQGKG